MAGIGIRVAGVLAAAVAAAAILAGGSQGAPQPTGNGEGGVALEQIGEFEAPVFVASAPGRANRKLLFVVEQQGVVRVIKGRRTLRRPFLDISGRVGDDGFEEGLLSIAFDPDYADNRRFYAYFTDRNGDIRVAQFKRSRQSKRRAGSRGRNVIKVPHPDANNHNGGTVAFGPDGFLYLGTGDGGQSCDPKENSQNTESLLGKLLRIDPKRRGGYRVPADNPFVGSPGRDEIYSAGLRNPYRFSFDEPTATIAIGDVGQSQWEEVDYESLSTARGANFGWDAYEGSRLLDLSVGGATCMGDDPTPAPSEHEPPIHEYAHSGPGHTGCSITGGTVVRDRSLPSLYGRYVYADFCTDQLRSLIPNLAGATDDKAIGPDVFSPSAIVSARRNRLYVASHLGPVYRVKAAGAGPATASLEADRDLSGRAEAAAGDGRGGFKAASIGSFSSPVYVHGPKGAKGLVFVVEQGGVIRMIKNGKRVGGKFLDISSRVRSGGEEGLLSVAFSPFYKNNRRFYVYFTDNGGDIVVQEFKASKKNPRDAKESSGRTVIRVSHPGASNHNGGQLQFGPDGYLYLATGDGGGGGDPEENAQNKGSLLGKLLRINPRKKGNNSYTVPNDNPFKGKPGRKEIYSLGLRNPYRFSFDSKRRKITIGDVGQDSREEVNYETLGGAKGANFGWDAFEGKIRFDSPDASPVPKNHELPIHDYGHGGGNCTVVGGYVVRDKRIKSLFGRYIYADFCRGEIRSLVPSLKGAKKDRSAGLANQAGISSFGEDARGQIYFSNLGSGQVFRIKPK